jgi:hypothetical protein
MLIEERVRKLIAKLDSENTNEQIAALAAIDHVVFTDVAMVLNDIADAEHRTGYQFGEIVKIIEKRWPRRQDGWAGMSDSKKIMVHRILVVQDWLSEHERRRLIEANDRLCLMPGNQTSLDEAEFMDAILRRAKREGVRI